MTATDMSFSSVIRNEILRNKTRESAGVMRNRWKLILRWLATPLVAWFGLVLSMILGILSLGVAESFCPPEMLISESCTAPYMETFEIMAFIVFPAIAAILVVWFPYLVAPKGKGLVAIVFYLLGAAYAVYGWYFTNMTVTLIVVLVVGALICSYLVKRDRQTSHYQ